MAEIEDLPDEPFSEMVGALLLAHFGVDPDWVRVAFENGDIPVEWADMLASILRGPVN